MQKYKTSYQSISDLYRDYKNKKITMPEGTGTWVYKENFIFDFFNKENRDKNILDVGCFTGLFLNKLNEIGFKNLKGIDVVDFTRGEKKFNFYNCDLNKENIPLADNTVDIVTAFQVLEHFENYFQVMHEVHRVLKPGGFFIFSVPNQFNIANRIKFALTGNLTNWNIPNDHLLFLTKNVFKKTYLNKFDLVKTHYDKGGFPFWGRLNKIPFVNFGRKKKILPRIEIFAWNTCYFLKKI